MTRFLMSVILLLASPFTTAQVQQQQQQQQQQQAAEAAGYTAADLQGYSPADLERFSSAQQMLRSQSQSVDLSQYMQTRQTRVASSERSPVPSANAVGQEVFGASLFEGGYSTERLDGINSSYRIAPGDKISINLWGAVDFAEVLTVDNKGNIFIPNIGPVSVADTSAASLNARVTSEIRKVYTNNVNSYINLLSTTPVSVFVSGPVLRPGQYAGLPTDSVIYFLSRAGGIDPQRGSYRQVSVIRDGDVISQIDLYEFLTAGKLPELAFKDSDTILVHPQASTFVVQGAAKYAMQFEFTGEGISGKEILTYAKPVSAASHVAVEGTRLSGPISMYVPLGQFLNFEIKNGDRIIFNEDLRPQVISVEIAGSYLGPSFYTVKKSAKLHDLLDRIEVDPDLANVDSIYLYRKSVANAQKQLLEEALQRLERSVFTAPASSDGEARIRAEEARLVSEFIERVREVEPLGKVVISGNDQVANINLENEDVIVIPPKTDLVHVAGEVLMPQAFVYNARAEINDYVSWAGGFTERANDDRIGIIHENGLITFTENDSSVWLQSASQRPLSPGDKILVLPEVDTKILQSIKDITQIVYQVAVAANVAIE